MSLTKMGLIERGESDSRMEVPAERNTAEVGWIRIAEQVAPGSVPAILGEDVVGKALAMAWLDPTHYPV